MKNEINVTIVSKDSHINGDIESNHDLRIEGKVEGTVQTTGKVIIGINGSVFGNIYASNLNIEGRCNGDLRITYHLSIGYEAKIDGAIYCESISIASGAKLNTIINMDENQIEIQPKEKSKDWLISSNIEDIIDQQNNYYS